MIPEENENQKAYEDWFNMLKIYRFLKDNIKRYYNKYLKTLIKNKFFFYLILFFIFFIFYFFYFFYFFIFLFIIFIIILYDAWVVIVLIFKKMFY